MKHPGGRSEFWDHTLEPFRPDDTPLLPSGHRAEETDGTDPPELTPVVDALPRRWRGRLFRLGLVAVVVVAVVVGALGVRRARATAELGDVEQRWLVAKAITDDRYDISRQIDNRATTEDAPAVAAVDKALDDEAAVALERVRKGLTGKVVLDREVRQLRKDMTSWIELQRSDWTAHRNSGLPRIQARTLVDGRLVRVSHRWDHHPARLRRTTPDLHAGDALLARLAHYFDEPTGMHLLISDGSIFRVVDVDASRHDRRLPTNVALGITTTGPRYLTVRDGFTAFVTDGPYAMAPSATGPARRLGAGNTLFPASRADAVWVADVRPVGPSTLRMVDGTGQVLQGPYTAPGHPVAQVRGGVLLSGTDNGLSVWDPTTGRIVRHLADTGDWVTSTEETVVWTAFDGPRHAQRIHVSSLAGKADRVVDAPEGSLTSIEALSPDGKLLAIVGLVQEGARQVARVSVLDLGSGNLQALGGDIGGASIVALTWTPDGTRLVIGTTGPLPVNVWRVGEDHIRQLRLGGVRFQTLVTMPTAT